MKFVQPITPTRSVSKLANQEGDKTAPKVSKLPLPISDSPLVIDLPDGQKIVVGKMTQGSVIEVATWRGVGRPDSRTSRLMLGMGNGNVNEDTDAEQSQQPGPARPPVSKKPQGFAGFIFTVKDIVKNFDKINWSATFKALLASMMLISRHGSTRSPRRLHAQLRRAQRLQRRNLPLRRLLLLKRLHLSRLRSAKRRLDFRYEDEAHCHRRNYCRPLFTRIPHHPSSGWPF